MTAATIDLGWRPARLGDVPAIGAVERAVHTLPHERPEVARDRIERFPEGCRVLCAGERIVGYGIAYPWRLGDIPPLDRLLGPLRDDADCLFIHDVALLPEARGRGAGREVATAAAALARARGLASLALVSVYGTDRYWRSCGFTDAGSAALPSQLAGYGPTAVYMTARA